MTRESEPTNIFGGTNCFLPNGEPCTACCFTLEVIPLGKPPHTECSHQNGKRCELRINGFSLPQRPSVCSAFHCSTRELTPLQKLQIFEDSVRIGEITVPEANTAAFNLTGLTIDYSYLKTR